MIGAQCLQSVSSQSTFSSGATYKELCVTDVAFEIQVESVANEWLSELKEDE